MWKGFCSPVNVIANYVLILLWQLENHFAVLQDKEVHFVGTCTVAMDNFFHLFKLHKHLFKQFLFSNVLFENKCK